MKNINTDASDCPDQREEIEQHKIKVIALYLMLATSIAFMLIPSLIFGIISLILFIFAAAQADSMKKSSKTSIYQNSHALYVSKTIWRTVIIAIITMIPATFYMHYNLNYDSLTPCAEKVAELLFANPENPDIMNMSEHIQPCIPDLINANKQVMIISLIISSLLPLLYMLIRLGRGLFTALGNKIP